MKNLETFCFYYSPSYKQILELSYLIQLHIITCISNLSFYQFLILEISVILLLFIQWFGLAKFFNTNKYLFCIQILQVL